MSIFATLNPEQLGRVQRARAAVSVLLVLLLVLVGALVIAALWGVGIYNSLVGLRNACKNAFAQVDVQL